MNFVELSPTDFNAPSTMGGVASPPQQESPRHFVQPPSQRAGRGNWSKGGGRGGHNNFGGGNKGGRDDYGGQR